MIEQGRLSVPPENSYAPACIEHIRHKASRPGYTSPAMWPPHVTVAAMLGSVCFICRDDF